MGATPATTGAEVLRRKWLTLFRAPAGVPRESFLRALLRGQASGEVVYNLAEVRAESSPAYDVIVETWADPSALRAQPGLVCVCEVKESVEKLTPRVPGAPPRAKLFSFIRPLAGLSAADFRRHWDEHVPIAHRVHTTCVHYVRHFVIATEPAPQAFHGVGMLAFETLQDLQERAFASPEGEAEVWADTAEFVGARTVIFTTEHALAR